MVELSSFYPRSWPKIDVHAWCVIMGIFYCFTLYCSIFGSCLLYTIARDTRWKSCDFWDGCYGEFQMCYGHMCGHSAANCLTLGVLPRYDC
jgi:hypothetical protein